MALIKCRECGHDVSTEAAGCPSCGIAPRPPSTETPTVAPTASWLKISFVLVGIAVCMGCVAGAVKSLGDGTSPSTVDVGPSPAERYAKIGIPVEPNAVISPDEHPPTVESLQAGIGLIRASGYMCNSLSAAIEPVFNSDFKISCDGFSHQYTLHDHGGTYIVQVKD